MLFTLTV